MKFNQVIVILLLVLQLLLLINQINKPPEQYRLETYIVQPGDTAWKIAQQYNVANKDIREIIYYMKIDNDIRPGYLYPGQEIKIRVYDESR